MRWSVLDDSLVFVGKDVLVGVRVAVKEILGLLLHVLKTQALVFAFVAFGSGHDAVLFAWLGMGKLGWVRIRCGRCGP